MKVVRAIALVLAIASTSGCPTNEPMPPNDASTDATAVSDAAACFPRSCATDLDCCPAYRCDVLMCTIR